MGVSFLFSFAFGLSYSQLFVRPPERAILLFCISFSWGMSWSLLPTQYHEPSTIVHQALCLSDLIPWIYLSLPLYNHKGFDLGHTWWSSGFAYFLQFKSQFGNKKFMIWATVRSWSYFFWLYRASPSLAAKNIINLDFSADHPVMALCRVFSCVVGIECSLWPVHSLGKTLFALAFLRFLLQGQICLLLQVFLDFLLLHLTPL